MQAITDADRALLRSRGKITLRLYFKTLNSWALQKYDVVSAKYVQSVASTSDFSIGNACSASVEIVLATGTDQFFAFGKRVKITWSVDTNEYPLIEGYVDSATRKNYQTTVKVYDYMYTKGKYEYPVSATTATTTDLIASIAGEMGITADTSNIDSSDDLTITGGLKNLKSPVTCYSALANIACCMGGNFLINRDGYLEFRRWSKVDFEDDPYEDNLDWDAEPFVVNGVTFKRTDVTTETNNGYTTETSTEKTYSAGGIANLEIECNIASQEIANHVYDVFNGREFYGGSTSFGGCLDIEAGDIIKVNSKYQSYEIAINEISFECDGGCKASITSVGSSTSSSSGLGGGNSVSQTIQNLQADYGNFKTLVAGNIQAQTAQIEKIEAGTVDTEYLKANYADIDFSNVNNEWVENGTIKNGAISSAMIHDLSANKIRGGSISAGTITTGKLIVNGQELTLDGSTLVANATESTLNDLTETIDRTLTTHSGTDIPTSENSPVSEWTDDTTKSNHVGDIYWVYNANKDADPYTYEYVEINNDDGSVEYRWQLVESNAILFAIQNLLDKNGSLEGLTKISLTGTSLNSVKRTADKNEATINNFNNISYTNASGETVSGIQNVMSNITQDQESINTTVHSFKSEEYTDDDGNVITGIDNVLTKSIEDLKGFKDTVSDTYYSKQEIDGKSYATTIQTETAISQAKTNIVLEAKSYTNSEIRTSLENRNLLRNSEFASGGIGWQNASGTAITNGNDNNIFSDKTLHTSSSALNKDYSLSQVYTIKVSAGEKLTFSGQYKTENLSIGKTSPNLGILISYLDTNGTVVDTYKLLDITSSNAVTSWTNIGTNGSITFSVPTSLDIATISFKLCAKDFTGGIYYKTIQLERGETKTDWSHSQLDYYTTKETAAAIEVASDSITSSVYSKDYINNNYSTSTQTATKIENYVSGKDNSLGASSTFASAIKQNANAITSVVEGYKFSNGTTLSSRFEQTENGFNLVSSTKVTDWIIPKKYKFSSKDYNGIGAPTLGRNAQYFTASSSFKDRYYLNTTDGYLYQCVYVANSSKYQWNLIYKCKKGVINVSCLGARISEYKGSITLKGSSVYIKTGNFRLSCSSLEINGVSGPTATGGNPNVNFGNASSSKNNGQVLSFFRGPIYKHFVSMGEAKIAFGHYKGGKSKPHFITDFTISDEQVGASKFGLRIQCGYTTVRKNGKLTRTGGKPLYIDCSAIYNEGKYGTKKGITGYHKGLLFQNGLCIAAY